MNPNWNYDYGQNIPNDNIQSKSLKMKVASLENKSKITPFEHFIFPITEESVFLNLERCIHSCSIFRHTFIKYLYNVAMSMKNPNMEGTRIGLRIIDKIFHYELLNGYSWTGVHKQSPMIKQPFNVYDGILSSFCVAISKIDKEYNMARNVILFRDKILKYIHRKTIRKR